MRRNFDEDLHTMHGMFAKMGLMVNENIHRAVKAFINHDVETAQVIKDTDKIINHLELDIEDFCFKLIALQQPVTTDLRSIITVMKAGSDLERMGDHAVSIARSVIRVHNREDKAHNKRIPEVEVLIGEMGEAVKDMVAQLLDAYVRVDVPEAYRIAELDNRVDDYFVKINRMCLERMKADGEVVYGGSDYILVAGFLERIGDYATNICERIVYLKTGELSELN